jgi:hypothetical protein
MVMINNADIAAGRKRGARPFASGMAAWKGSANETAHYPGVGSRGNSVPDDGV